MVSEREKLTKILRDNEASATSTRLAIFATLLESERPLKNGEVASRTPSVNRASVYRTLELFERLGITTTLVRGWTPFVELADPFKPHHHHLLCDSCGKAIEITSQKIETLINELALSQSFTPISHHLEIKGVCKDCKDKLSL